MKLSFYLAFLVVISLCNCDCKATSSCEMKAAESYLDVAIDMIEKAKNMYSGSVSCDNSSPPKTPHSGATHQKDCNKHDTPTSSGVTPDGSCKASDCSEALQMGNAKSGVYTIWPVSRTTENKSLEVYCDMVTAGGGWTVIQRRGNFGRANDYFFKDWKSYKEGFGDIKEDFWLGNDNIFALSNQRNYSVRFDLRDVENLTRYAQYDTFWIGDETAKYVLHIQGYSGDAGDSMTYHHNHKFTTKDQDNDLSSRNCAEQYKGAWWYTADNCYNTNLHGLYIRGKHSPNAGWQGMNWYTWKGWDESLDSSEIKIRPKNFIFSPVSSNTLT